MDNSFMEAYKRVLEQMEAIREIKYNPPPVRPQQLVHGACPSCSLPLFPAKATVREQMKAIDTHDCVQALTQALNTAVPWHKQEGVQ